jgi:transposase InsO family protein
MTPLTPTNRREELALFRAHVLRPILFTKMTRGALKEAVEALSHERFQPPGEDETRTYAVPTLLRWRRAWRHEGLAGLIPKPREDRGHGRALTEPQKALVLDIRREYPSASAELIVRTLVADGRLEAGQISAGSLRRVFAEHGLHHASPGRQHTSERQRLPWQMSQPNELWHGDVCHGIALGVPGKRTPLRVHGLLDDASRYFIALEVHTSETEEVLLGLLVSALRRHGRPDGLYFDNGATYRGDSLAIACARLGMGLHHARPYDPKARGKMERAWRTLRASCLDFVTAEHSLTEVQTALDRFKERYHDTPHAGLGGKTPAAVFAARTRPDVRVDTETLATALTVEQRRRVRQDSTLALDGVLFEVDAAFLAGHIVTVKRCLLPWLATDQAAWVEHDGRRVTLTRADPRRNAHRRREAPPQAEPRKVRPAFAPVPLASGRNTEED